MWRGLMAWKSESDHEFDPRSVDGFVEFCQQLLTEATPTILSYLHAT